MGVEEEAAEFREVFDKLKNEQSSTRTNERFTLEYSPNPIWYAVQALPYLMEFPHECAEQVFSRIYANGIAWHITEQQPRLRSVYNSWKDADAGALVSNLEKNQELKAVLLEETPWVLQAKNETERKRRIGVLFDAFRMRGELSGAIAKLEQMQRGSGAFPWSVPPMTTIPPGSCAARATSCPCVNCCSTRHLPTSACWKPSSSVKTGAWSTNWNCSMPVDAYANATSTPPPASRSTDPLD